MPASSAQPLYDRERPRRRPAPDWGGDDVFGAPSRRFARVDDPDGPPGRLVHSAAPPESDAGGNAAGGGEPPRDPARRGPARNTVAIVPERRTVTITGRPDRLSGPAAARPGIVEQRLHARPDRLAMWAFALGVLLILVAVATSV